MTLEAAAGKNPVTHVGKLYNLGATAIANRVHEISGIGGAACVLVSQIGRPIHDPQIVDLGLGLESEGRLQALTAPVSDIVIDELHRFHELRADLLAACPDLGADDVRRFLLRLFEAGVLLLAEEPRD